VRAFTLIEAVIVLLVIGILTTVSTITYRTVETSAYDHSAQLTVSVAAGDAEHYYNENAQFPNASDLSSAEPSYSFINGSSPNGLSQSDTQVSVFTHSIAGVEVETFTTLSTSGNCYEETTWPPNVSTPNSYVVTSAAQCYAANASDTTEATQW
jgi:type II secretory pathway pseudopilin PulG